MFPSMLAKRADRVPCAHNSDRQSGAVTATQALLAVVLIVLLLGLFAGLHWFRAHRNGIELLEQTPYSFTEDSAASSGSVASQVNIVAGRGDITVVPEDSPELRLVATKTVYGANQRNAEAAANRVHVVIQDDGNGEYDIRPTGLQALGTRGTVSIEVHLPRRAAIRATTGGGNVNISGAIGDVSVQGHGGVVEVRDSGGDVSVSQSGGNIQIVGDAGNIKISGQGKELEIVDIQGRADIDGKFAGPIHLARIAKGVHLVSEKTNLTVTRLDGQVESGAGGLRISGNTGDITLKDEDSNVSIANPGGRVQVTGDNGRVAINYTRPPREDISVDHKAGSISLSLPPQSAFKINAQTIDGNLNTTFTGLAEVGDPEDNNLNLYGQVGANGPMISLRNSYGDININRRGF